MVFLVLFANICKKARNRIEKTLPSCYDMVTKKQSCKQMQTWRKEGSLCLKVLILIRK